MCKKFLCCIRKMFFTLESRDHDQNKGDFTIPFNLPISFKKNAKIILTGVVLTVPKQFESKPYETRLVCPSNSSFYHVLNDLLQPTTDLHSMIASINELVTDKMKDHQNGSQCKLFEKNDSFGDRLIFNHTTLTGSRWSSPHFIEHQHCTYQLVGQDDERRAVFVLPSIALSRLLSYKGLIIRPCEPCYVFGDIVHRWINYSEFIGHEYSRTTQAFTPTKVFGILKPYRHQHDWYLARGMDRERTILNICESFESIRDKQRKYYIDTSTPIADQNVYLNRQFTVSCHFLDLDGVVLAKARGFFTVSHNQHGSLSFSFDRKYPGYVSEDFECRKVRMKISERYNFVDNEIDFNEGQVVVSVILHDNNQ